MTARYFSFSAIITTLLILTVCSPAFGEGYGFYSWSRGWPTVNSPDFLDNETFPIPIENIEIKSDIDRYSFGYMYVSPASPTDLFNYRFSYGMDILVSQTTSLTFDDISESGLSLFVDQYSDVFDALGFGFMIKYNLEIGLIKTDAMRVWIGPGLRLNANYLKQEKKSFDFFTITVEAEPYGAMASLGGGIEAGITYRFNSEVALDLSAGFYYSVIGLFQDAQIKTNFVQELEDRSFFWGREPSFCVQLALHFGLDDKED